MNRCAPGRWSWRERSRFGYRRLHVLLQRDGERTNHKRLYRVYRVAGLSLERMKRKHCVRTGQPLQIRTAANQEFAFDFAPDAVACGRAIRMLSVVEAYPRECLAQEVDTSFASRRVTHVLDQVIVERVLPEAIRCDNGPELTSRHFLAWCIERKIDLVHIQPGSLRRTRGSRVFTDGCGKNVRQSAGSRTCSMRAGKSRLGGRSTTKSGHTAVWAIAHQRNLRLY